MAISDKLTYLNTTKTKIREGLNSLGADLDTEDTFRSYADAIEGIYEDYPKITGEGESLSLDNTKQASMQIDYKGNTSQVSYSGINLIEPKLPTQTIAGITLTNNGDGSYKINGTATANASFRVDQSTATGSDNLKDYNGTYTLSCNELTSGMQLVLMDKETYSIVMRMNGNNTPVTSTINKEGCFIYVYVANGTTINNLTIKPMLEKSSSASAWQPYVGGIPSPNPSYPQPINVVSGDNTINICGKNLLGLTNGTNTSGGLTITRNNGKITFVGTASSTYPNTGALSFTLEPGTYTISSTNNNYDFYLWFRNSNNDLINSANLLKGTKTITVTSNNITTLFIGVENLTTGTSYNIETSIQIEKGSSPSTYEPYIGSSYPIYLGVENLLDLTSLNPNQVGQQVSNIQENSFIMSGTAVWGNEYFFYENTNKNTTYTASCKYLSSLARKSGLSIYGTNETTGENLTTINSLLVDIPANVETPVTNTFNSGNYDYIVIRYWNNATATALSSRVDLYVKEVQLEKGTKANSYTPYGTTPIELCKIGTYQDYIYKDNGSWYLHKEINKVVLDGSETWYKSSATTGDRFYFNLYQGLLSGDYSHTIYCNKFFYKFNVSDLYAMWLDVYTTIERLFVNFSSYGTTNVTQFKEWLSNEKPIVYLRLLEPTNTLIEDATLIEQLEALKLATSYEGQTNISQENNDLPFILDVKALRGE